MKEQEILQRIARFLILQSSFINNIGLLHGKMGIVLFFYIYSRFTKNRLFENYANNLVDEIYKQINVRSSIDFENGLAGIAWGVKYLIDNKYVVGDTCLILKSLDSRIQEWDVRRIKDYSLKTGLKGLAYYIISRYGKESYKYMDIPYEYIKDLVSSLMLDISDNESRKLIKQLNCIIHCNKVEIEEDILYDLTKDIHFKKNYLFSDTRSFGITDNGLAGIGLNLIWKIQ